MNEFDEKVLKANLAASPPPPLSPALSAAVAATTPVRTRTRFGAFAVVLVAGVLWPMVTIGRGKLRGDLGALPPWWVAAGAVLWAAAFLGSLAAALIPRPGDVLVSPVRAVRVGVAAIVTLGLFALLATVPAPGVSLRSQDLGLTVLQTSVGCGRLVVQMAAVILVVGVIVLRRAVPLGGRRLGVGLGAAGGAIGGLALHFLCPIAETAHVVFGHVGGVVVAALIGAAVFPLVLDP